MPREHSKRESLECSDADCSEQRESSIAPETLSEGSKHEVVQSDDEDLPAAELEWGLAQRATDPQYRQRKQKGRFMFVKISGCVGFHCYEDELVERLQQHDVNVQSGPTRPVLTSHSQDDAATTQHQLTRSSSFSSTHSRHKLNSRPCSRHATTSSTKAATNCTAAVSQAAHRSSKSAGRKRWERATQE